MPVTLEEPTITEEPAEAEPTPPPPQRKVSRTFTGWMLYVQPPLPYEVAYQLASASGHWEEQGYSRTTFLTKSAAVAVWKSLLPTFDKNTVALLKGGINLTWYSFKNLEEPIPELQRPTGYNVCTYKLGRERVFS